MMLLYFYSINRFPLCFQTHVPRCGSIPLSVVSVLVWGLFFRQERNQRSWVDPRFRCEEGGPSAAALQGFNDASGKMHRNK